MLFCRLVMWDKHIIFRYFQRQMPVAYLKAKPAHFLHGVNIYLYKGTACKLDRNAKLVIKIDNVAVAERFINGNAYFTSADCGLAYTFLFSLKPVQLNCIYLNIR